MAVKSLISEIKVSKSAALKASYLDTSLVTRLSRLGGHTAVLERSSGITAIRHWWPDCLFYCLSVRQVHSYVDAIGLATSPTDKELWLMWMH